MRAVAMALLFGACVLAGRAGARRLYRAADEAADTLCFLRALRTETANGTELCTASKLAAGSAAGAVFPEFAQKLSTGLRPSVAWRDACGNKAAICDKETRAELDRFFDSLGGLTLSEQIRAFERAEEAVKKAEDYAKGKAREGGKVRTTLGVLAGFSLVILLV